MYKRQNLEGLDTLLNSGNFPNACSQYCDVTDRASIERALQHFDSHTGGRMDVLVNNAVVLSSGKFEEIDHKAHDLIIDVNVKGLTNVAQAAFPLLRKTPGATLVNLCSVSSIHGIPALAVYSASKFYVNGLTEALHIEWQPYDIRVTSVKPPVVNTAMGHQLDPKLTEKMAVNMAGARGGGHPDGRRGPAHRLYPGYLCQALGLAGQAPAGIRAPRTGPLPDGPLMTALESTKHC